MHVSSNRPVSEDEKADDVCSRRHLYCDTPVVTSWAVAGQQVVFLHMYLQTRVTLEAFPVATPRGRSSSSHEGEQRFIKQFLKNQLEHFLSVKFKFSIIRSDILGVIFLYFICSLTKCIICNGIYLIILSYILGEQLTLYLPQISS